MRKPIQINTSKAIEDRNYLLSLMGCEADEMEATQATIESNPTMNKYGAIQFTEIEHGYSVSYEKDELYINDLQNTPVGTFVGE